MTTLIPPIPEVDRTDQERAACHAIDPQLCFPSGLAPLLIISLYVLRLCAFGPVFFGASKIRTPLNQMDFQSFSFHHARSAPVQHMLVRHLAH